ncbi:hypothetical protein BGZ98_007759 [Dissophora globulifera]|nr:hypothetical protein BGZ98_007759 [Dissophora globulifera]
MGCFIQKTGFLCAPLSTTRGFLYTLDPLWTSSNSSTDPGASTSNSTAESTFSPFIPILSTATNNNNTHPSPPLLGVDGQPINYEAPSRLGQSCIGIPLPGTTDPLFQILVTVAVQRLNDTIGYLPGIGAGQDLFSLRGDCEQGSYCDLTTPGAGVGTCREQLPNFHNCTSYMQCISLRCDEEPLEPTIRSRALDIITGKKKRTTNPVSMELVRRAKGPEVCMPSKLAKGIDSDPNTGVGGDIGGGSNGSDNSSDSQHRHHTSMFPAWMGAIIAIIIILGAAIIFGLARWRKKIRDEAEKQRKKKSARTSATERHRQRLSTLPSHIQNEKAEYLYQTHTRESESAIDQQVNARHLPGFLGMLFEGQRKETPIDTMGDGARVVDNASAGMTPTGRPAASITDTSFISQDDVASFTSDDGLSLTSSASTITTGELLGHQRQDSQIATVPASPLDYSLSSTTASRLSTSSALSDPTLIASNSRGPISAGLSVIIPRITTTQPEQEHLTPTSSASSTLMPTAGLSRFSEGESPIHRLSQGDGGLAPTAYGLHGGQLSPAPSSISSSSPSPSESSSHTFLLSTTTQTLPAMPNSPISPISPISPRRPALPSGQSSRLSHRQSSQVASRKL